jgi:hypothetical protein
MAINPSETPLTRNPGVLDIPPLGIPTQIMKMKSLPDGAGPGCRGGGRSTGFIGDIDATPLAMANEQCPVRSPYMRGCGSARYAGNGGGEALDRVTALLSGFQQYSPPTGFSTGGCGALSNSCRVSSAGGNLVAQELDKVGIDVRFLGLLDPVRTSITDAPGPPLVVPGLVWKKWEGYKDPPGFPNLAFGTAVVQGIQQQPFKFPDLGLLAAHIAMGDKTRGKKPKNALVVASELALVTWLPGT